LISSPNSTSESPGDHTRVIASWAGRRRHFLNFFDLSARFVVLDWRTPEIIYPERLDHLISKDCRANRRFFGEWRFRVSMRVLYVIFVLSVGALVWAAVAAARHIRRHEAEAAGIVAKHPHGDELADRSAGSLAEHETSKK
jgi:hypothetical protein